MTKIEPFSFFLKLFMLFNVSLANEYHDEQYINLEMCFAIYCLYIFCGAVKDMNA